MKLPSALGGVQAAGGFSAVDGVGLRLDTLKVSVKRVRVGAVLRVEDIGMTYTRANDEWASRATVYLPGPKSSHGHRASPLARRMRSSRCRRT